MINNKDQADGKVIRMICANCPHEILPNNYVNHLRNEAKDYGKESEKPLKWDDWYHQCEMTFLRSKVIFSNGLVLYKQVLHLFDREN